MALQGSEAKRHQAQPHEIVSDPATVRTILGQLPVFIWKYSPALDRTLFASESITELAGLERADFLSNPASWDARVGGDASSQEALGRLKEALREGRACESTYRFQTAHRGERWFKSVANPVDEDGEIFIYCCVSDVTGQRENEENCQRLATALEQADEAVVITDREGWITYVNGAFERMTGYRRAEAVGQRPSMLKSGRQDESFYKELWQTISGGMPWRGRFINRRKDGTFYEQWATIAPIRDESGAMNGYVAVQLDMTHQLELERRLAQAERLASVGEAIAGAAHTIKNILNTMRGSAFMVGRGLNGEDPDKLRQSWEVYQRSTARLDNLTHRMLDYVRAGEPDLEPLDLNELAAEVVEACRAGAAEAGVKLAFDPEAELPKVPGDRAALHDAMLNLVGNAIEACAPRGRGRVRLATRAHAGDGMVELWVEDNGPGIPPETQTLLFQPFFTTKGHKGNGLGLAMVQKSVQAHHGTIAVETKPGRTCFRIKLPM